MWWVPLAASAASALLSNGGGSGGGNDSFGGGGLASSLPALGSLGGLFGGGGGTRTSVSQSTNVSLAVNPVIANQYGDGGFTASPTGNATGYPTSNANASGNDGLPTGYSGLGSSYPSGYGGSVTPPVQVQSAGDGAMLPLVIAGGAALLLLFND